MNKPRVEAEHYIQFLVASPAAVSGTEAARVQASGPAGAAHDAYTRLLHRLEPDAHSLWQEAQSLVARSSGVLVLDDTTLDKPYARQMGLRTRHWSGKHGRVVAGINLLTLLWSDGQALVPIDYRLYDKGQDGQTKNDHFAALLTQAHERGFTPTCVLFDSWYASLANLKHVRACGWPWLTRLKRNRLVRRQQGSLQSLDTLVAVPEAGEVVWLKGYGPIRLFRCPAQADEADGAQYWASSEVSLCETERAAGAHLAWGIEQYHRGLKQCCGVEKAQVRAARAQRNHIGCALRAFLRLESQRLRTGYSWYETKKQLLREALRTYLAAPTCLLHFATA